jgi:hypothetical protein
LGYWFELRKRNEDTLIHRQWSLGFPTLALWRWKELEDRMIPKVFFTIQFAIRTHFTSLGTRSQRNAGRKNVTVERRAQDVTVERRALNVTVERRSHPAQLSFTARIG